MKRSKRDRYRMIWLSQVTGKVYVTFSCHKPEFGNWQGPCVVYDDHRRGKKVFSKGDPLRLAVMLAIHKKQNEQPLQS